ncbi:bacterio-opsin activator HTH domain-containing protein [Natronococcus amylolyticus DSM 10524]|uniref:Bacterio-opsin activator HTH domain-containing protein n=1 Tax=Natronococcus amylolyticus DSM 10524 TaxID=1227497 RepID=L9X5R9_9EURY|nr:helix-turn-helix domain-containing protein [Natronococcus amylolyticus]ELY57149.1 bacterio-opsin activator HTH domain-containing protein [Natronococcus amylolyticus DSM 10524]
MSTIAEFRIPAADTTLEATFDRLPELRVELEAAVSRSQPCLWIADAERTAVDAALADDPSVGTYDLLVETSERLLYDVTFVEGRTVCDRLLADGGSLLEGWGTDGWWQARVRYRDREALCRAHDRLVDRGIGVDLRRVTDVTPGAPSTTRLTGEQEEALEAALEQGYFEIPREISMEELADELGISHQALSERLRRAYETLVNEEIQPVGESET